MKKAVVKVSLCYSLSVNDEYLCETDTLDEAEEVAQNLREILCRLNIAEDTKNS